MDTCSGSSIIFCGHVDHGKSTILGRLLADSGAIAPERVTSLRDSCARDSKAFEFAYLIDSFREERSQNITIEAARVPLRMGERELVLIDAPGHEEFVRNMVTGASRADAAMLTIDAAEGVRESTRRHAALLALLGIRRIVLAVNKMDLVAYSEREFRSISGAALALLTELGLEARSVIPVSGIHGANLIEPSREMPWYSGPPLLELLVSLSAEPVAAETGGPFRMPVQEVYKFQHGGSDARIVAGTVASGAARSGDELLFLPSRARARVARVESGPLEAGRAVGFTLDREIFVARGQVAVRADQAHAAITERLAVRLFWLGTQPLTADRDVYLKLATQKTRCRLERVDRLIDSATLLEAAPELAVHRGQIAECLLSLGRELVVDPDTDELRRFVLVDGYEIAGGGIIVRTQTPECATASAPDSPIATLPRAERSWLLGQKPALVFVGSAVLAGLLEKRLLEAGRIAARAPLASAAVTLLEAGLIAIVVDRGARGEAESAPGSGIPTLLFDPTSSLDEAVARTLAITGLNLEERP